MDKRLQHQQNIATFRIAIGFSRRQRLIIVSHTYRGRGVRIISARLATNTERHVYEEGK